MALSNFLRFWKDVGKDDNFITTAFSASSDFSNLVAVQDNVVSWSSAKPVINTVLGFACFFALMYFIRSMQNLNERKHGAGLGFGSKGKSGGGGSGSRRRR